MCELSHRLYYIYVLLLCIMLYTKVIDKLVEQRARNEMITLMFEVEMDDIQQTRHILASVTAHLQQLVSNSKHRLVSRSNTD